VTTSIPTARWRAYRAATYRLAPRLRLRSADDAVNFVNERGFTFFWPNKDFDLPSLWAAVAGERPVADAHDDPGHVTWAWKDQMLPAKRWFYAKLLRGRATMVSLATLPYYYALSENYGDTDDYLLEYEAGRLSQEAKAIYEVLLEQGACHTVHLHKATRLTAREAMPRFDRALTALQVGLKILPIGVAQAGAWRYSFIYELVDRHFPDLPAAARPIGRGEARAHLLALYLRSVGAATEKQITSLFRWKPAEATTTLEALAQRGAAVQVAKVAGEAGAWWATPAILE
jgi:hypothetical protein